MYILLIIIDNLFKALNRDCSFHPNPLTNMATIGNSCVWLVNYSKHLWKVLYKISSFHADWTKKWSPWASLDSDWLIFKKSSSLKLGGTMNCYFVGMMYGRSCTKFSYFVCLVVFNATFNNISVISCRAYN